MRLTNYTILKNLKETSPKTKIKLVTIQNTKVLDDITKNGFISGNHEHSMMHDEGGYWKPQYDWMKGEMSKRIPNFSGDYPIWSWYKSPTSKEIRQNFGLFPTKITFEVPLERCLISDFDLWNGCLKNFYYHDDIDVMDKWLDGLVNVTNEEIQKSWEVIFDLDYPKNEELSDCFGISPKGRGIQICVDRVYEHELLEVKVEDGFVIT